MLFTVPSRYSSTIGHQGYLALEGGPPCFPQDSSGPVVLRPIPGATSLRVPGSHRLWPTLPGPSTREMVAHSSPLRPRGQGWPPTPSPRRTAAHSVTTVWAPPRSLTTTWGIALAFSSCGYSDVSLPRVPLDTVLGPTPFRCRSPSMTSVRFPHSGTRGSNRLLTAHRGFSQPATPFLGPWHLGIHHAPFLAPHPAPSSQLQRFLFPC